MIQHELDEVDADEWLLDSPTTSLPLLPTLQYSQVFAWMDRKEPTFKHNLFAKYADQWQARGTEAYHLVQNNKIYNDATDFCEFYFYDLLNVLEPNENSSAAIDSDIWNASEYFFDDGPALSDEHQEDVSSSELFTSTNDKNSQNVTISQVEDSAKKFSKGSDGILGLYERKAERPEVVSYAGLSYRRLANEIQAYNGGYSDYVWFAQLLRAKLRERRVTDIEDATQAALVIYFERQRAETLDYGQPAEYVAATIANAYIDQHKHEHRDKRRSVYAQRLPDDWESTSYLEFERTEPEDPEHYRQRLTPNQRKTLDELITAKQTGKPLGANLRKRKARLPKPGLGSESVIYHNRESVRQRNVNEREAAKDEQLIREDKQRCADRQKRNSKRLK